jgi:hypothetical protein
MLAEDLKSVDANGDAIFDIAEILESVCESNFAFPVDVLYSIIRDKVTRPYFVRYYEAYGNPFIARKLHTSPLTFCCTGGIPPWKQPAFYHEIQNFFTFFNSNNMNFLTWLTEKKADLNSEERLYLMIDKDEDCDVYYHVKAYYNNGTEEDIYPDTRLTTDIRPAVFGDVFEICVGYKNLNLGSLCTYPENLIAWEIRPVINGEENGTYVASTFRFNLDRRIYPNTRYFMFKNSLGAFESVIFTGEAILESAITRTQWNNSELSLYEETYRERKQRTDQYVEKMKASTGWITVAEREWLRELLMSEEVYELKNNARYPVIITSDKVEICKDNVYLYALSIEYEYTYMENIYQSVQDESYSDGSFPVVVQPEYNP